MMETVAEKKLSHKSAEAFVANESVATTNISIWKPWQKVAFRISFIFFVVMSIPTGAEWWQRTFKLDWFHPNYRDIYDIARFLPDMPFVKHYQKGFWSYNDWYVILGISIFGGAIWTLLDKNRKEYNRLYYWLRVIVRYRAGIGMVGFGMQKIFPVQMAYPPQSILNASFGDMTMQKHYWWLIGVSPFYQVFTGFVEVVSGLLLFHRKTTFWGAALLVAALGSVNYVNIAYDGNVHVYSTYFVLYGLFLMAYYAKDIYGIQFEEQYTIPQHYYPSFSSKSWKFIRAGLKSANVFIFLILLVWLQYLNFVYDPYNQPSAPGVKALRGYYNVTEFKINGRIIPFSPLDSIRWQNVYFEKWSTLSFKINMPIPDNISERMNEPEIKRFVDNNGFGFNSGAPVRDIDRTYEIFAANQRSFYYRADTVDHVLYLQDKATFVDKKDSLRSELNDPKLWFYKKDWITAEAQKHMFSEIDGIQKIGQSTRRTRAYNKVVPLDKMRDRMVLHYEAIEGGKRIYLSGLNEFGDSIHVTLDRVDKKYLLPESVLIGGKY
jgi:hypothetical protein